jgi:hypothetical protein
MQIMDEGIWKSQIMHSVTPNRLAGFVQKMQNIEKNKNKIK